MIAEKPQRQYHAMYRVGAITRTNNSTTLDHKDNVSLIRFLAKNDVNKGLTTTQGRENVPNY